MKFRTVEIEIVSVILDVSALIFTSYISWVFLGPHTMLQLTEEEKWQTLSLPLKQRVLRTTTSIYDASHLKGNKCLLFNESSWSK